MTEVNRRVQVFCAWCGPAFAVLLFGGWGFMGGFIPLIGAGNSAQHVASLYAEHQTLHKVGLILGMVGVFLTIPYFLVISLQMRRMERGTPVLAILQLLSGIIVTVVLMIPMLLFVGGAFRPERPPELTQLMNDISYVMLILPWPPILGQLFAIGLAVLNDHNEERIFPRWTAGYQFWVAFLLLPASLIIFFRTGPFAWTGLIGFWIPAAVFGSWYLVMTWVVLRAIRTEPLLPPLPDSESERSHAFA